VNNVQSEGMCTGGTIESVKPLYLLPAGQALLREDRNLRTNPPPKKFGGHDFAYATLPNCISDFPTGGGLLGETTST
jgi:hypothetical protein